jgi:4-hydroxybenzoate polyprenyltransferase
MSLLRLPNLLLVFLCQWLPYWWIVRPALLRAGALPVLTERTFGLLAWATVLTTLAGYIINDVFDYPQDLINRPRRTVIGRWVPVWAGVALYALVLATALYAGVLLGRELPPEPGTRWRLWPFWLFPAVSALLFLYAWKLKCTPLWGNVLVALLCAVVPLLVLWPEQRPLRLAAAQGGTALVEAAAALVWVYGGFAFATTLLREQIKTLQDVEGDAACGCATLPVRRGVRFARIPAMLTGLALSVLLLLLLVWWQQRGAAVGQLLAGALLLLLPTVLATAALAGGPDRRAYRRASLLVKAVMLAGVVLLLPDPAARWEETVLFVRTNYLHNR